MLDVHRKTNLLAERPVQQNPTQGLDAAQLQLINDGLKNIRFDIANAQANNKVRF